MMKYTVLMIAALTLTACGGSGADVTRMANMSTGCAGVQNMNNPANLPVRCGPQAAAPHTSR